MNKSDEQYHEGLKYEMANKLNTVEEIQTYLNDLCDQLDKSKARTSHYHGQLVSVFDMLRDTRNLLAVLYNGNLNEGTRHAVKEQILKIDDVLSKVSQ